MLYNQLFTFVRPFFVSRWGASLSNNDILEQYINISIQDMWDFHDWTFKIESEDLVSEANWDFLKWTTRSPIDRVIEIRDEYNNQLNPTTWRIINSTIATDQPVTLDIVPTGNIVDDYDCKVWDNFIITKTNVKKIYVKYYKAYNWIEFNKNGTDPLPFPNKFIPPLINKIYDLWSPLMYFEDDNVVPRYQIAVRQLNELKNSDWISADVYYMPDKSV